MGVYTHVAMADLHDDVESLPRCPGKDHTQMPALRADLEAPGTAAIPTDLADLAGNWAALPDHIRRAITALANG